MIRKYRKHIQRVNEIVINDDVKYIELHLEKSLKYFSDKIILDVGFNNMEACPPENINYTVIYKNKDNKELKNDLIIKNIHSDIFKLGYWKMPFEKTIGNLVAHKLIISVSPHLPCSFWLFAYTIPSKP